MIPHGLNTSPALETVPRTHELRKLLAAVRTLKTRARRSAALDDTGDFYLKACILRELRVATDAVRKLGRAHGKTQR